MKTMEKMLEEMLKNYKEDLNVEKTRYEDGTITKDKYLEMIADIKRWFTDTAEGLFRFTDGNGYDSYCYMRDVILEAYIYWGEAEKVAK